MEYLGSLRDRKPFRQRREFLTKGPRVFACRRVLGEGSAHSIARFRTAPRRLVGLSVAFACLCLPVGVSADERLPGVRTASYEAMPERERIALVVGASHVLARWMRANGEPELNCFYNRGTYTDVVEAVDAYVSSTPSAGNQLFSETLIRALATACQTDMDRYLED